MERTGSKPIDELIILAKNGNGLAFTALWDRHIDQLRSYLNTQFKNLDEYSVEDICSRSFEKAFRKIHTYDQSKSQFLTWLCTIARNTALDALEAEKRSRPSAHLVSLDDAERVKYIDRLPELYREVARRRLIDGMKYNEIAESLDLELNTVKTRLRRAKQIMDELRERDEEE